MTAIVGIVNCTPDSFSDAQGSISHQNILRHAKRLCDEGADILDIGGDSTRPGSTCPGIEEEWTRIAPILEAMSTRIPCSVDTHHVEVARRAIDNGATFINDISGDITPTMASLIASAKVSYIAMFNAHAGPHIFGKGLSLTSAFSTITQWMSRHTRRLESLGIPSERIIADPGMGAFISEDPRVSLEVLERFSELPAPQGGLLLGCSRKGFLASPGEKDPSDRDHVSCIAAATAVTRVAPSVPTYIRVHNVALQRKILFRHPAEQ